MYKQIVRPLLFRYSADHIHETTIQWAGQRSDSRFWNRMTQWVYDFQSPRLEQNFIGLHFRNPVGLAAGFDKNGLLPNLMESLGFGFCEIGSVTAQPSTGNPIPRSFRLPKDHSLINRMGLNNDGAETIVRRLQQLNCTIPLGINIAKTHNPDINGNAALEDYYKSFQLAKSVADYITINISCPNTREGKTFETPDALHALLSKLELQKETTAPPVLVKFSSDLSIKQLEELIDICQQFPLSGYVATNTSTSREGLTTSRENIERIGSGGLSGFAIRDKSTQVIKTIHELTQGDKLIIGVGGIFSVNDAIEKIAAGADLIQVYTGLIYRGPSLVRHINRGINDFLKRHKLNHIYDIRR